MILIQQYHIFHYHLESAMILSHQYIAGLISLQFQDDYEKFDIAGTISLQLQAEQI
jgi:hypothetical protein